MIEQEHQRELSMVRAFEKSQMSTFALKRSLQFTKSDTHQWQSSIGRLQRQRDNERKSSHWVAMMTLRVIVYSILRCHEKPIDSPQTGNSNAFEHRRRHSFLVNCVVTTRKTYHDRLPSDKRRGHRWCMWRDLARRDLIDMRVKKQKRQRCVPQANTFQTEMLVVEFWRVTVLALSLFAIDINGPGSVHRSEDT